MKIIFAGTPDFAAQALATLLESNHEVVAVYTQPDRPAGRGRKLTPSPVKQLALQHHIPVCQPRSLKDPTAQAELRQWQADLMVVAAYGLILPQAVLDTPPLGCINIHASLLPRWRGAAPIHRALLAGDSETGITIMQMDAGLDTGAMLHKLTCPITALDTSASLHDRLAELGGQALLQTLDQLGQHNLTPQPQDDSQACYADKLHKQEGEIDWHQPAEQIDRHIRGLYPWPMAYTFLAGDTIRIHQAQLSEQSAPAAYAPGQIAALTDQHILVVCGDRRLLALTQLQLSGGRCLPVSELLHARRSLFAAGTQLGHS